MKLGWMGLMSFLAIWPACTDRAAGGGDGGLDKPQCRGLDTCSEEGAMRCGDSLTIQVCQRDEHGCLVWQASETCDGNRACMDGHGQAWCGCLDWCQLGETSCGLYGDEDVLRICGTDEYGCRYWAREISCQRQGKLCMIAEDEEGEQHAGCFYECGHDELTSKALLPRPQCLTVKGGELDVRQGWQVWAGTITEDEAFVAEWLVDKAAPAASLTIVPMPARERTILIGLAEDPDVQSLFERYGLILPRGEPEAYLLETFEDTVLLTAHTTEGLFRGVQTLLQLIGEDGIVPRVAIYDYPDHEVRAVYVSSPDTDLYMKDENGGRDGPAVFSDANKAAIDRLASLKINMVVYEDRSGDFFKAVDDPAYLQAWLELADYCRKRHIQLVPKVGSLRNLTGFDFPVYEGWWIRDEPFVVGADGVAHAESPFQNLITNGGFEQDADADGVPDGWSVTGSGHLDGSQVREGSRALVLPPGSVAYRYFQASEPGIYYFRVWGQGGQPTVAISTTRSDGVTYVASDYLKRDVTSWRLWGVMLKVTEPGASVRLRLGTRSGTVVFDDAALFRVNGALRNVIRTDTTDVRVVDADTGTEYALGQDFEVVDGDTAYYFDESLQPFQIRRLEGGRLQVGTRVLVSYDAHLFWARSRTYNQPPCVSDGHLYSDYYEPALALVVDQLHPPIIHLASDEIRGFNRDSRNASRNLSNAELFSEWLNRIHGYVAGLDPSVRLMIWDDMVSYCHNGGNEHYQLRYGGPDGAMYEAVAQRMIPSDVLLAVWWYGAGAASQMHMAVEDFGRHGFRVLGAPWYDEQAIAMWFQVLSRAPHSEGALLTEWGYQGEHQTLFGQLPLFADLAWNSPRRELLFSSFEQDTDQDGMPDGWLLQDQAGEGENLVPNPSFENGLDGWEIREASDPPEVVSTEAYEGSASLHVQSSSQQAGSTVRLADHVSVQPGLVYRLTVCGKANGVHTGEHGWHTLFAAGRFYDVNLERPYGDSAYMLDANLGEGTYDWKCVTFTKRAPQDAAYFRIESLGILGTGTGEAWVDAVAFGPYVPPAFLCDSDTRKCRSHGGPNERCNRCAVSVSGTRRTWTSSPVDVHEGLSYVASAYVRGEEATTEHAVLTVVWQDRNGATLSEEHVESGALDTDYVLLEGTFTAPSGARRALLRLSGSENGQAFLWFDDVSLSQVK